MARTVRLLRAAAGVLGTLAVGAAIVTVDAWRDMGTRAEGDRLAHMTESPQWRDGAFDNALPRQDGPYATMLTRWVEGGEHAAPAEDIEVQTVAEQRFEAPPPTGLRITWLGHSSLLIEIDGRRLLVDPVWSERCSPLSFAGPKRFHPPPLPLSRLPAIDAVVISHDHYDHLDTETILALKDSGAPFFVPLGVGAHLEYWGVPPERIVELDWWQSRPLHDLALAAVPARHFSGRSLVMSDQNATLWAGWVIVGPRHRVYYSGDTAMFPGFREIGRRYGPFDATMIEVGAYDALWADVHLGPEQAVLAHRQARGRVMFPVHWGTFELAMHGWTEPMERTLAAAEASGVTLATPMPGQSIEPADVAAPHRWWPSVPWQTAAEAPVLSSGLTDAERRAPE